MWITMEAWISTRQQPLRLVRWVVLLGILIGSICPSLYGDLVPHQHLFVGGPPPVGWERHEHPDLLTLLFGPIQLARSSARPGEVVRPPLDPPGAVHVLSVYNGLTSLVLSDLSIAAVAQLQALLPPPILAGPVIAALRPWQGLPPRRPPLPPPRPA